LLAIIAASAESFPAGALRNIQKVKKGLSSEAGSNSGVSTPCHGPISARLLA